MPPVVSAFTGHGAHAGLDSALTRRTRFSERGPLVRAGHYVKTPKGGCRCNTETNVVRGPELSSPDTNFFFNGWISSTNSHKPSTNASDPCGNFNICVFAQVRKKCYAREATFVPTYFSGGFGPRFGVALVVVLELGEVVPVVRWCVPGLC